MCVSSLPPSCARCLKLTLVQTRARVTSYCISVDFHSHREKWIARNRQIEREKKMYGVRGWNIVSYGVQGACGSAVTPTGWYHRATSSSSDSGLLVPFPRSMLDDVCVCCAVLCCAALSISRSHAVSSGGFFGARCAIHDA